jgi:cell division protein FtsI (penicillin-binding protein 3)
MAVNKKNIMTRYFFVILLMGMVGVSIVIKAGITMFAERQYWQDVADRFIKENVTVKPSRGNIISSDGRLMATLYLNIVFIWISKQVGNKRHNAYQSHR